MRARHALRSWSLLPVVTLLGLAALAGCGGKVIASGGSGGGGGGAPVACKSKADCGTDAYCHFADYKCGKGDAEGVCTPLALDCEGPMGQECTCEGKVASAGCAAVAGQDISVNGLCTPPLGMFMCGYTFCKTGLEFCMRLSGPITYFCQSLPAACAGADACPCLSPGSTKCASTSCAVDPVSGHPVFDCAH